MRHLLLVCTALLLLCSAPVVRASPLFELTGGFGGMGGLQARHTGPSAASAYFNPALLTGARTGLTAGVLILNTDIGVHVRRRSSENDIPSGLSDTFYPDGTAVPLKPLGTDQLQNGDPAKFFAARPPQHQGSGRQTVTYGALGLVLNLFKERFAIGVYGLVPVTHFLTMSSYYVDEREQTMSNSLHPELYGDRLTPLSFAFAAGVKLTRSLSLGIGTTLGVYANADAPVFVASASQLANLDLNIRAKAKIALTPHFGFAWHPGTRWHLTGALHAPQKADVESSFTFVLAGGTSQSSSLGFTYFFMPWQASAGIGYDFYVRGDEVWSASFLAHYQRWSKYIDRQSVRPDGAYAWLDTLSGSVGVRRRKGPLSLALDGQYKPTPVPDQTGRTNYVDNNRLGASFSLEYAFTLMEVDMAVGLQLQAYRLLTRSVKKLTPPTADGVNRTPQLVWDEVPDNAERGGEPVAGRAGLQTNNPGWPGFMSAGWVSSGGLYLSVLL
jgi:long-chain fatty acid transport protein